MAGHFALLLAGTAAAATSAAAGTLGTAGAAHAYDILHEGLVNVMHQTGCNRLDELADRLV